MNLVRAIRSIRTITHATNGSVVLRKEKYQKSIPDEMHEDGSGNEIII